MHPTPPKQTYILDPFPAVMVGVVLFDIPEQALCVPCPLQRSLPIIPRSFVHFSSKKGDLQLNKG